MVWRRVGETWWLEEALKELDEWVLKRIRKLSIMAGGGALRKVDYNWGPVVFNEHSSVGTAS